MLVSQIVPRLSCGVYYKSYFYRLPEINGYLDNIKDSDSKLFLIYSSASDAFQFSGLISRKSNR